jgi:hypothetical protein
MRTRTCTLALALVVVGCGGRSALVDGVHVEPAAITPNGDGQADVARISYEVGQPATVTITLTGPDGTAHVLRDHQQRPPGTYDALFGGVIDGHMLPDGAYAVTVRAEPTNGHAAPAEAHASLSLSGGDTTPPVLQGFTLDRPTFTPNQDGLGDEVHVSYHLDEPLASVRLWLESADGRVITDIVQEKTTADDPTAPGAHDFRFDAGVKADAPPPPNGDYFVVAEARDQSGNVSRQRLPLKIAAAGKPSPVIKSDVVWSASSLPLGGTLYFTATVQNVGDSPIRTRGPEPGYVYDNNTNFSLVAPQEFIVLARNQGKATSLRIPADRDSVDNADLDLAKGAVLHNGHAGYASPSNPATGPLTPLSLLPTAVAAGTVIGDSARSVRLCGTVTDGGKPVSGADVYAFEADGDNGVKATTDVAGHYCFAALTMPPPLERNFAESSGAMRLGLQYDDSRQSVEYPFRWQLGRTADLDVCATEDRLYLCLPPDKQVQITGGVRFVEPPFRRLTRVYLGLKHEDVKTIQSGYGSQQLTLNY